MKVTHPVPGCRFPDRPADFRVVAFRPAAVGRMAFTLIELLVVVGMMAVLMSITIPFMHTTFARRSGMNGGVKDVQEICKLARDWAILKQATHELQIRPDEGVFEVKVAGRTIDESDESSLPGAKRRDVRGSTGNPAGRPAAGKGGGTSNITLPEGVIIEGLGINGLDWTEDEVGRVRFYPNGTSDEMSIVLYWAETGERRNVWLEVVTGLAEIETDPKKFRHR